MNLKKLKSKQAKEIQYQRAGNDPFEKLGVWGIMIYNINKHHTYNRRISKALTQ